MKGNKLVFIFIFILFTINLCASPKVIINLTVSAKKIDTNYFFASNINGWDPSSKTHQFKKINSSKFQLEIIPNNEEIISFKITRGTWDFVECDLLGKDIQNRIINISEIKKDTIININISNWKDEFFSNTKASTASINVKVFSEKFYFSKLGKHKKIWVYTPSDYLTSTKKYEVLYMHDGQNLFDELTCAYGEWGVDECMDTIAGKLTLDLIIVGIENGFSDRLSEYSPYNFSINIDEKNKQEVVGKGSEYLDGIVNDLKPAIDKKYRTKKDSKNTFSCGSSMGGLISMYAIMRYPNVFGKAGVYSPSFWVNIDSLKAEIAMNKDKNWKGDVYMSIGSLEGEEHIRNVQEISKLLESKGKRNVKLKINEQAQHNEAQWRAIFPLFLNWLATDRK